MTLICALRFADFSSPGWPVIATVCKGTNTRWRARNFQLQSVKENLLCGVKEVLGVISRHEGRRARQQHVDIWNLRPRISLEQSLFFGY